MSDLDRDEIIRMAREADLSQPDDDGTEVFKWRGDADIAPLLVRFAALVAEPTEAEQQRDELLAALKQFTHAVIPVSTEINVQGRTWCEPYLDNALVDAQSLIAKVEESK